MMGQPPLYAIIGELHQDYAILPQNETRLNVLGGSAAYAASGSRIWASPIGLLARIGPDYPQAWLDELQSHNIDCSAVKRLDEPLDTRAFYVFLQPGGLHPAQPAAHFLRLGLTLPKALLGYRPRRAGSSGADGYGDANIHPEELPSWISECKGVHLCPADYLCHAILPSRLRELKVGFISVDPAPNYLMPAGLPALRALMNGLDVFLPDEDEARLPFQSSRMDVWETAAAYGEMGVPIIVIKRGPGGACVFDARSGKRWNVPAYPSQVRDLAGSGDSFCGAFLAGLGETGDPAEAGLRGCVAASLTVEGHGPIYPLQALPGLAQARLQALRPSVRAV
jgi:sugar/nucleoside kinase (ribokinase family)